jgi:hypothetical protein
VREQRQHSGQQGSWKAVALLARSTPQNGLRRKHAGVSENEGDFQSTSLNPGSKGCNLPIEAFTLIFEIVVKLKGLSRLLTQFFPISRRLSDPRNTISQSFEHWMLNYFGEPMSPGVTSQA